MKLYTAQYRYSGSDRLDITNKSGDKTFSPSDELLKAKKYGDMTDEEYRIIYLEEMKESKKKFGLRWLQVLNKDEVTFVCFCPKEAELCHRWELAKIFVQMGATYVGERNL